MKFRYGTFVICWYLGYNIYGFGILILIYGVIKKYVSLNVLIPF